MKYYTDNVSPSLAKKLKEKGMPIPVEFIPNYLGDPEGEAVSKIVPPSFAFVFDWLMDKDVRIAFHTYPAREPFAWGYKIWTMDGMLMYDPNPMPEIDGLICYPSWHEAATKAIEKALTLI